jgi:aspartyl protease family protein
MIDTANGRIVAHRVTIKTLKVGSVTVTDIAAVVSEAFGDQDIIGMNFLSRLASWRVEGRILILQPNEA